MDPPDSSLENQQGKYIRARDNPFFDGMRRRDPSLFDFLGKSSEQKISRFASDIGQRGSRYIIADIPKTFSNSSSKGSTLDITLEPIGQSLCESFSETVEIISSQGADIHSENNNKISNATSQRDGETTISRHRYSVENSYCFSKNKQTLYGTLLPPSAASFYNGYSPQMEVVESCKSIERLNLYLKASKDAVNAGVPGSYLRAVLGQQVSDVGSFVSTIMYSFYLNETQKNPQFCTVPVFNIKRADLNSNADLKWLLDSCNIDQSSLLFIDEVDLSYYDIFGSLKLITLNADMLQEKQEGDLAYPSDRNVTDEQDCSCCALIAEKFALSLPEILAGRNFCRLLLAGILLDTKNLTNPQCTSIDQYMTTLLINGAGRFGCNGLYHILRYKRHDISDLNVGEILQKDFRKWRTGKAERGESRSIVSHVGMSSIGISVAQLLSRDETSTQEIIHFQQLKKLGAILIVSGYYDSQKNFKREILVSAESKDLVKSLFHFLNSHASRLPLKDLFQPGLSDEMRAFSIDKVVSRRTIEQLLQNFTGT